MRAMICPGAGLELGLRRLPVPSPGPDEVRVRIRACGMNFADLLMIRGEYQERADYPFVPGMEIAGEVDAIGPGASGWSRGDRVAVVSGSGGLADFGCFPASRLTRIPKGMDFATAAGFQVAYGTSHLALERRARLEPGETLLVTGAAGGVGLAAVETGRLMGARVIAVARGKDRLDVARRAGAEVLLDSDRADLRDLIRDAGGADVAFDPVGGAACAAALSALRPEGRLLVIGFASGTVPDIRANHLLVKNVSVLGFWWGGYLKFRPEAVAQSLATLFGWHAEGRLAPHVHHLFPIENAAEGLDLLRSRQATGKIVVTMD